MIIIGGSFTVTGAIAGALFVTIGYEFLRWIEKVIKFSDAIKFEFIGLTEIVLSITMIVFLVTKPKGLFPFLEIGEIIKKKFFKKEQK